MKDEIDASYVPIDVGFDLRLHEDLAVKLPEGEQLRVLFMRGDDVCEVEGSPRVVAEALRKAGYRVL